MLVQAVGICAVFSAHAEVVPLQEYRARVLKCILRARGGSSPSYGFIMDETKYSPRTRR